MARPVLAVAALVTLAFAAGCAGTAAVSGTGGVILHAFTAEALRPNLLGDPPQIRVAVYLPPGYRASSRRRYPVIYLLHGWLAGIDSFGVSADRPGFQGMQLVTTMDQAVAQGVIGETIVVVPEARNRYFGSFYANSPVTGRWEDAIVRELVPWVDGRYRTVPGAAARGIAGFSMGGYGAITLAMKHPEVFGAVYAASPCCLAFAGDLGPDNPGWANATTLTSPDQLQSNPASAEESFPTFVIALGAALSPNPARPGLYVDLPFARVDGELRPQEPAYSAWKSRMPAYVVGQYRDRLRRLRGIALDVGAEDEFAQIPAGARLLSQELERHGIAHRFEVYAGGTHTSMIRERIEKHMLPFFARVLGAAE